MKKRSDFDENLELQRLVVLEVAPDLPGRESRDRTTAQRDSSADEEELLVDPAQQPDKLPTGAGGTFTQLSNLQSFLISP